MQDCLFCKMIRGEIKPNKVFEDDRCLAFLDINPQAPLHALIIPKKHVAHLAEAQESDAALLGHLLLVGAQLAKQQGYSEGGFRTVINTNADAGQSVFHLHVHVLGGRQMDWPPG